MPLQRKVRAGVLLYALLMLAVFSVLLQFYLNRQVAESQLMQANQAATRAYLMAELTMDEVRQAVAGEEENQVVEVLPTESLKTKEAMEEDKPALTDASVLESPSQEEATQAIEEPVGDKKPPRPTSLIKEGSVSFTDGEATYLIEGKQVRVEVRLSDDQVFAYHFPIPSQS